MNDRESPSVGPPLEKIEPVFQVYETRFEKDHLIYYGEPTIPNRAVVRKLGPVFRERGYELSIKEKSEDTVLIATRIDVRIQKTPWLAIGLVLATIVSTLMAGAAHYHLQDPWAAPIQTVTTTWPFAVSLMIILATHELGHYVMTRYHGVRASVPYFIPVPTIIGTLGAVIQIRGRIPDNKALFDIGVAGPIAGLILAVCVSVVGLLLPPVTVPESVVASGTQYEFGYPPLLQGIAWVLDQRLTYPDPSVSVNPIVVAGWVGMFVTFLNLLPVGQIDGGHMLRAMLGKRKSFYVAVLVPFGSIALAGVLFVLEGLKAGIVIWVAWALLTGILAIRGGADPLIDQPVGVKRVAVGILTYTLGLLCFTPIPIAVTG